MKQKLRNSFFTSYMLNIISDGTSELILKIFKASCSLDGTDLKNSSSVP
jgi:hypothetical protein